MKQLFEGLASLRTKIANVFHYEANNSFNKTEFHFHGPVNFIGKRSKRTTLLAKWDDYRKAD